jgi:hypothetical protein
MTEITHEDIRDLLPDLLHERLGAPEKRAIESHLAGCADCRAELSVLRMVQAAPSYEPRIDAVKLASVIPPYSMPAYQAPVATRVPSRVLLALAAAVVIVGSVVVARGREESSVAAVAPSTVAVQTPAPSVVRATPTPVAVVRTPKATEVAAPKPRELQLAAGLDGVSDSGVQQLLRELDSFDGLPSAEPEPVGLGDQGSGGGR